VTAPDHVAWQRGELSGAWEARREAAIGRARTLPQYSARAEEYVARLRDVPQPPCHSRSPDEQQAAGAACERRA
jgi:hypothetical protein